MTYWLPECIFNESEWLSRSSDSRCNLLKLFSVGRTCHILPSSWYWEASRGIRRAYTGKGTEWQCCVCTSTLCRTNNWWCIKLNFGNRTVFWLLPMKWPKENSFTAKWGKKRIICMYTLGSHEAMYMKIMFCKM